MTFSQTKKDIMTISSTYKMDEYIENLSFCDDIANAEYCELYEIALIRYHAILEDEINNSMHR